MNALGPGKCIALPADLQSIEDIKRLVEELSKREDRKYINIDRRNITDIIQDLDVLVNNAGATWGAPLDEYPDAAFQKVMNLNVTRIFTLTQA